jgi:Transcriptional regulatory protein, C terminal
LRAGALFENHSGTTETNVAFLLSENSSALCASQRLSSGRRKPRSLRYTSSVLFWLRCFDPSFDHSLNKAVNRLREALEDSADQPRFIETLPRRGYRFIAAIASADSSSSPARPPDPALPITQQPLTRLLPWPLPAKIAAGAGILVVVVFAIWMSIGGGLRVPNSSSPSIQSLAVLTSCNRPASLCW